jgi:Rod binding domain-containing protein
MITNQLADSLSRNGGIGLAKTFVSQLTAHAGRGVNTASASPERGSIAPAASSATVKRPEGPATGSKKISHS